MAFLDEELASVSAILVEDRMLRRIIKRHRGLGGLGLQVPHAHCYAVPKSAVSAVVLPTDLDIDLAKLPDQVIVLNVDRDELEANLPEAWTKAWRLAFHGKVHQAFEALLARKTLTAGKVRERIHRIGQTEFDEVRLVLRQEDLLFPPEDDVATYVEFVALYLELQAFAPRALEQTFPSLHDAKRVAATIALDLDAAELLAATRPPRAPESPVDDDDDDEVDAPRDAPRPSSGFAAKMYGRAAEGARRYGNHARAAILSVRAGDLERAHADLTALVMRLAAALAGPDTTGWADALLPVAQFAAGDRVLRFVPGARLLHDLQAACVDAEKELQVVDAVTWALSRGKTKIVRSLPATREIRVARHLHSAAKKIVKCEVGSAEQRQRLADAVHHMVDRADQNVRAMMRPKIEAALEEVELRPRHLPERVAQKKIVDELLDHAVAGKRLTLGNLRDAIAHNDLKLPDLDPVEIVTGDPLLRADAILAESLDGVYRRGEIYMRFLQKVSSVLSGNVLGRLLTLYILLPVVGAFFVVEGLQHMVGPAMKLAGYVEPHLATTGAFVGVGIALFLLLHVPPFRASALALARQLGRGLRVVFWDVPRRLWRVPLVRPFTRWILLPALPASLFLLIPGPVGWVIAACVFAATAAAINASVVEEMVSDWALRSGRQLTQHILPGLVKYSVELFARLIELLERAIYRVDEALRFRPGQSRATVVIKGVLGTVWFVVSYFLRFYVNLFIEPTINPIKHFPVVTVAAKLIIPFIPQMKDAFANAASPLLGDTLGQGFGVLTVLVLPGIAGFLAWELNGNWKLYRANRAPLLEPESFGSHGETMVRLMRPGFHSGTIPKLHGKLRRASWKKDERAAARHKEGLHHVEEAIRKFTDRQLVSMLNESLSFRAIDVAVGEIELGSNRVRIELVCPSVGETPVTIAFEQQSGWILAGIPAAGWIVQLDPEQRRIFEIALAGFYKLSGVDVVREQVEPLLAAGAAEVPAYDIADAGLVMWPGPGFDTEIVYAIESSSIPARVRGAPYADTPPVLGGKRAVFGREPLRWAAWTHTWERLAWGMELQPLLVGPSLLPQSNALP